MRRTLILCSLVALVLTGCPSPDNEQGDSDPLDALDPGAEDDIRDALADERIQLNATGQCGIADESIIQPPTPEVEFPTASIEAIPDSDDYLVRFPTLGFAAEGSRWDERNESAGDFYNQQFRVEFGPVGGQPEVAARFGFFRITQPGDIRVTFYDPATGEPFNPPRGVSAQEPALVDDDIGFEVAPLIAADSWDVFAFEFSVSVDPDRLADPDADLANECVATVTLPDLPADQRAALNGLILTNPPVTPDFEGADITVTWNN